MPGANIDLLLVGVSHKTAPVAVRERLAVEPDAVATAPVTTRAAASGRPAHVTTWRTQPGSNAATRPATPSG